MLGNLVETMLPPPVPTLIFEFTRKSADVQRNDEGGRQQILSKLKQTALL